MAMTLAPWGPMVSVALEHFLDGVKQSTASAKGGLQTCLLVIKDKGWSAPDAIKKQWEMIHPANDGKSNMEYSGGVKKDGFFF